jgi:hypothetical protein
MQINVVQGGAMRGGAVDKEALSVRRPIQGVP